MNMSMDRRDLLKLAAVGAGVLAVPLGASGATVGPFQHGVASGDPLPTAVIIWTRVTPTADASPGSGIGPVVTVLWQMSLDEAYTQVVATGTITTGPERDHTVHVDVTGLTPGTPYHYRFLLDGVPSPSGRTRTAPDPQAAVGHLRLGVVSCANWEAGYFSAYRHLATRADLFGVVHLGDYLYEYGPGQFAARGVVIRPHIPAHETLTLADYRARHGQYKTDPDLQALHAAHPWMIVWDDHEAANDSWSGGAENHTPSTEGSWVQRLAASRQAYFEWMPVRTGPAGEIYRTLRFGDLAELTLLDLRTYRSQQTSGAAVDDPSRTMTGAPQMAWLKNQLAASQTRWRLVGTSVIFTPVTLGSLPAYLLGPLREMLGLPEGGEPLNNDQWDGYTADRKQVLTHLSSHGIGNTVFLAGDIHCSLANDVPLRAATYPFSPSVAVEFVVPSLTSDNLDDFLGVPPRTLSLTAEAAIRATNLHVKGIELDSHGFGLLDVRPGRVQMDWYRLSDRTSRTATAAWMCSFATDAGTQKTRRITGPVS